MLSTLGWLLGPQAALERLATLMQHRREGEGVRARRTSSPPSPSVASGGGLIRAACLGKECHAKQKATSEHALGLIFQSIISLFHRIV